MSRPLRGIAEPFIAAAPAGARIRTRLRVSPDDEAVLRAAGSFLGTLAGRDLAARCAEGRLDARGRATSRAARKRALTAVSSSRWAGAITRTSEDTWQFADRNLRAERSSLQARVRRIEARTAVAAGTGRGRARGYATPAERHAKTIRLKALEGRLATVERRIAVGTVSVVRGGKDLLRKRLSLAAAGLTEDQWRRQWDAARLFLTADGEKDKAWGNETIRWNPEESWLEVKLPAPLEHLANRPHGRYRLSCQVTFTYQGDKVAAQAATGAVRYDIGHDPQSGRWYLDASWKMPGRVVPSLTDLRGQPVVAVDVNAGHLAVAVVAADGNVLGRPFTIPLALAGLPASARDGRIRAAVSRIICAARTAGAKAVVIEDLDFAEARAEGRERARNRPSCGRQGRRFRAMVAGIPTARFRDRLTQMTCNVGLHVIVTDPAYSSRWGGEHWLAPPTGAPPSGNRAPRGSAGDRATRPRPPGQETRDREPHRPGGRGTASPGALQDDPGGQAAPTRKRAAPPGRRPPHGAKTGRPDRTTGRNQAPQDRSGTPAEPAHATAQR